MHTLPVKGAAGCDTVYRLVALEGPMALAARARPGLGSARPASRSSRRSARTRFPPRRTPTASGGSSPPSCRGASGEPACSPTRRETAAGGGRGSEPTGDEASHAECANAMKVHGAVHQVLSTATIGTSNLVRNEWSVTTSAGRLILPRPIRWRSPSARARSPCWASDLAARTPMTVPPATNEVAAVPSRRASARARPGLVRPRRRPLG
jgi:hypothetical protein